MLFLDEPSAGLDPQARLEIHELMQELRREQRTILLTTHYIEEAERLCDRVAIIDEGRIVAMGTPREIRSADARPGASRGALRSGRWPRPTAALEPTRSRRVQRRPPDHHRHDAEAGPRRWSSWCGGSISSASSSPTSS